VTRRSLILGLAVFALHAVLLAIAARWSFVSALLSPGAHSRLAALLLGGSFLSARLLALVAIPPVAAGFVTFLGVSALMGRPPRGR
jgi:hypothetical protein